MTTPPNTPVPEGSVIITPAEVYREVKELTGEVRDLITADKAEQRERARLEGRVDSIDTRVSALERRWWIVVGAAIGGSTGGTALIQYIAR